jgi:hypothetical protein
VTRKAANVAVGAAVGVVVDADPHRRRPGNGQAAARNPVRSPRARLDIGFEERICVAAGDLRDLMSDHLGTRQARPFDERLVDEAIAPAAVDVGNRQSERVELALRKRREAVRARAIGRLRVRSASRTGTAVCVIDMRRRSLSSSRGGRWSGRLGRFNPRGSVPSFWVGLSFGHVPSKDRATAGIRAGGEGTRSHCTTKPTATGEERSGG